MVSLGIYATSNGNQTKKYADLTGFNIKAIKNFNWALKSTMSIKYYEYFLRKIMHVVTYVLGNRNQPILVEFGEL